MQYTEQSINDLRLYVVTGEPDLEQFEILARHRQHTDYGSVVYGILGASHFLTIKHGETEFTEICACIEGTFNESQVLFESTLNEAPATLEQQTKEIDYTFSHQRQPLSDFETTREAIRSSCGEVFHYIFPSDEAGEEGITFMGIDITPEHVMLKTIHTYPNESLLALTESTFTIKTV